MEFSNANISDALIKVFFNTLIHSLWQGLILAVFAGLAIVFTRNSSAKCRYNLLIGGLIIFCFGIASTFYLQLKKQQEIKITVASFHETTLNAGANILKTDNNGDSNNQFLDFLYSHANTIVLVWFLVVLVRTLQLLTGLHGLGQLRKKAIFTVGGTLAQKVLELATRMGITSHIEIAESAMIKIPMVIGHLKPLILIPMGLLAALPPSAIEAIIVHELAHISRRDYLVNLLLSLIEVVFFFNPAVLWLATLIKAEREHCCDDMVVLHTNNKTDYIRALIACQEYHSAQPVYAMALTGNKSHLLVRVKRMVSKNNQPLNVIEKSLLSIGLVIAGSLTVAFSNVEKINKIVKRSSPQVLPASEEIITKTEKREETKSIDFNQTVSVKTYSYTTFLDTAKCEIYLPNQVDDQTNVLIRNGDFQTRLLKQNGILYQINSKGNLIGSLQVNGQTIPVSEHQRIDVVIDSLQHIKRTLLKLSPLNTRQDRLINRQYDQGDSAKGYKAISDQYQPYKTNYTAQIPDLSRKSGGGLISIEPANSKNVAKQLVDAIMQDDLAQGDVKSFKLSKTELIVNGKKIPDNTFKSFVDRNISYFKDGACVYYNFDTKTTIY